MKKVRVLQLLSVVQDFKAEHPLIFERQFDSIELKS